MFFRVSFSGGDGEYEHSSASTRKGDVLPSSVVSVPGILRIVIRGHLSTGKTGKTNCVRVTKNREAKAHHTKEEMMEHKRAPFLNRENAVGV